MLLGDREDGFLLLVVEYDLVRFGTDTQFPSLSKQSFSQVIPVELQGPGTVRRSCRMLALPRTGGLSRGGQPWPGCLPVLLGLPLCDGGCFGEGLASVPGAGTGCLCYARWCPRPS